MQNTDLPMMRGVQVTKRTVAAAANTHILPFLKMLVDLKIASARIDHNGSHQSIIHNAIKNCSLLARLLGEKVDMIS